MKTNKKTQISRVISQFLSDRYSVETERKVQEWLVEEENSEEKEMSSLEYWNKLVVKPDKTAYYALGRIKAKTGIQESSIHFFRVRQLLKIAAVLLPLFLIAGVYYYSINRQEHIIEVDVPFGEKKQCVLPDGSVVSLNSGTIFRYPEKFSGNLRTVELTGEAYFSVKRDVSKPFVVKTNHLSVRVLGTQFNVNAYLNNNRTITTLISGKVEVNTNSHNPVVLDPNQQLIFDNNSSDIVVNKVPSDEIMGWTSGHLIFINSSINEILKTLERKFNVSIQSDPLNTSLGELYTIKFLKNENLEQILDVLKDVVGGFSYQKEGNRVSLHKNIQIKKTH
jgi:transmembrane sensor